MMQKKEELRVSESANRVRLRWTSWRLAGLVDQLSD